MKYFIEEWFPVQIMVIDASHLLDHAKLIFELTDFSKYEREGYPNGSTTYFDEIGLPLSEKYDWSPLVEEFANGVKILSKIQGVEVKKEIKMTEIWLNRMWSKAEHSRHAHPCSHYSGTFYVSSPPNSGNIRFHNPAADFWGLGAPNIVKKGIPSTSMIVDYSPAPGKLLIWNSWLFHEVLPSEFEGYRDSISFNFYIN